MAKKNVDITFTMEFKNVAKAKSNGGDRYRCEVVNGEKLEKSWDVYFIQEISRQGEIEPKESLIMTIK